MPDQVLPVESLNGGRLHLGYKGSDGSSARIELDGEMQREAVGRWGLPQWSLRKGAGKG